MRHPNSRNPLLDDNGKPRVVLDEPGDIDEDLGAKKKKKAGTSSSSAGRWTWLIVLGLVFTRSVQPVFVTLSKQGKERFEYVEATATLQVEVYKLVVCVAALGIQLTLTPDKQERAALTAFSWGENRNYAIPGLCYAAGNLLWWVALGYINAALAHPLSQMKILFTAVIFWFVFMEQERAWLSLPQLMSMVVLFCGAVVSTPNLADDLEEATDLKASSAFLGFGLMMAQCCCGALGNVYSEKVMKKNKIRSIFFQNVQLYGYSIFFTAMFLLKDLDSISTKGFFFGYDKWAFCSIGMFVAVGFVCSFVFKYLDSVIYLFINVCCIFFTAGISSVVTTFQIDLLFVIGAVIVTAAVITYKHTQVSSYCWSATGPCSACFKLKRLKMAAVREDELARDL